MRPDFGNFVISDRRIFDELMKNEKDALWFWNNARPHRMLVFKGLYGRLRHKVESDEEKASGLMAALVAHILAETNSKIFFDIVPTPYGVKIAKIDEELEISDDLLRQVLSEIYAEKFPDDDKIAALMSKYRSEIISLGAYKVLSGAPKIGQMTKSIQNECKKLSGLLFIHIFGDNSEK